jgi:Do/DeqQ family serine protease
MKRSNTLLKTIAFLCAGILGGLISAILIHNIKDNEQGDSPAGQSAINLDTARPMQIRTAAFSASGEPVNFSDAAEHAVSSVVHVKVSYEKQYYSNRNQDIFDFFFGNPTPRYKEYTPQKSSGSGVIISADGYIVTNNHVIDKANEVTVTLNDKTTLTAEIVGKDPTTDIALLKVETDKKLPALRFANSDDLRLGEWVLAVGNPFNFTSTVTAGIISAKARTLNIIPSQYSIEAFIQTDAAVNPGNSGGALVNLKGELVGINTAIVTHTGSYEGYSFAVPSNIVKKVMEDLIQHGVVQRAFLGISYLDLNEHDDSDLDKIEREYGENNLKELKKHKGVYISEVLPGSAAKEAGIEKRDIITKIGDKAVTSKSVVVEEIGKLRPGDRLNLTVIRDGKTKQFTAILRNNAGNTEPTSGAEPEILGAKFQTVSKELAGKLKIAGGIQVTEITEGKLSENGVRKGFIITKVNSKPISSEKDLINVLREIKKGGVFIEGIYPSGQEAYIAFGI